MRASGIVDTPCQPDYGARMAETALIPTELAPTSPMLDLVYGRIGERWRFKEEADDLPCLRTPSGAVATDVTDNPSSWPMVVHEVIWAMESGLSFTRAVVAVVNAGLAGPMNTAEVRRLIRRLPSAVEREVHGLQAEQAEVWLDETVDIADGVDGVGADRAVADRKLMVDTRLTIAGMRAKERYKPGTGGGGGGGVTVNVVNLASPGTAVGISGASPLSGYRRPAIEITDATHATEE